MTTRNLKHKTCTVPGCAEEHAARGYCNRHYLKWWKGRNMDEQPPQGRIRLRERRVALGLTQEDMSQLASIGRSTYTHIEGGLVNIKPQVHEAINAAFEARRLELIAQHREAIRRLEALKPLTTREIEEVE